MRMLILGYHDFSAVKPFPYFRRQNFCTLHFVLAGKGRLQTGGKEYILRENDVFFLDDKTTFMYVPEKRDPWEYVWFSFDGPDAAPLAEAAGFSDEQPARRCLAPWKVRAELSEILRPQDRKNLSIFRAMSALYAVFDSVATQPAEKPAGQEYAEHAKLYIEEKMFDPSFRVESLCDKLHISHAQLCRIFKKYVNSTPVAYIAERRLDCAAHLLKSSALPVCEIAYMSGYDDADYFQKSFKKKYGRKYKLFPITAVSGGGLQPLLDELVSRLEQLPPVAREEADENFTYRKSSDLGFEIFRDEDGVYVVEGTLVDMLCRNVVLSDPDSMAYFQKILREKGVISKLKEMGIKEGETVSIGEVEFDFVE